MDGPDRLRLLERAVTASTNSIVITDPSRPDAPLVYVNPAFERTTGYAAEEALGRNCRFLQGEDRDQPALGELRAAVREERHCTVVLRNYRKNGTLFYNELSVYPVRGENDRLRRRGGSWSQLPLFAGRGSEPAGARRAQGRDPRRAALYRGA